MTVDLRSRTVRAGAGAIVAAVTDLLLEDGTGDPIVEAMLPDGMLDTLDGPVAAVDVAHAAAAIVAKLLTDVEAVLGIDRTTTVAKLGAWVATQETDDG